MSWKDKPRPVVPLTNDAVVLSPEEIEAISKDAVTAALAQARAHRRQELKEAAYWWAVANPAQAQKVELDELKHRFMANARANIAADYKTDNGTAEVLNKLAHYFAGHEGFNDLGSGYSLNKGIMLVGTIGVGKSSTMREWGKMKARQKFGLVSCIAVHAAYTADGVPGLEVWMQPSTTGSGICFDDLGAEVLVGKNFGNEAAPMVALMLARYDLWQAGKIEGAHTHITTNLPWSEIQRYGDRFTDRLKEMFNIITFPTTAPSRRA